MQESVQRTLAAELGITPKQAEEVILALCRHLRKQIAIGQPVHVPDLGTFELRNGTLTFLPDRRLRSAVAGDLAALRPYSAAPRFRKRSRYIWGVGTLAASLSIIAAGVWWTSKDNHQQEVIMPPVTGDSTVTIPELVAESEDTTLTELLVDTLRTAPLVESPDTAVPEEDVAASIPDGLNRSIGGYTLIVASFQEASVAQTVADQYRTSLDGVPVDVLHRSGEEIYRVAVGQTPTIAEALSLRSDLPDLPAETWVLRIY